MEIDEENIKGSFENIMKITIEAFTKKYTEWNERKIAKLAKSIPELIVNEIYKICKDYKLIANCVISKKNQVNPKVDSISMWEPEKDFCVNVCLDNERYYCAVNLYAVSLN